MMHSQYRLTILAFALFTLAACGASREPIIDRKGVSEAQLQQDWQDCEAYSEEVRVAEGVARGTAVGAAVGAVAGAIRGDASDSAGIGGLYGGTASGLEADREKTRVFKNCMRGRGYRVLN